VDEEYRLNRLRGMVQLIQAADRQEGRGQMPWVQKELIKELMGECDKKGKMDEAGGGQVQRNGE